jgi:hypothetical protein
MYGQAHHASTQSKMLQYQLWKNTDPAHRCTNPTLENDEAPHTRAKYLDHAVFHRDLKLHGYDLESPSENNTIELRIYWLFVLACLSLYLHFGLNIISIVLLKLSLRGLLAARNLYIL